MSTHAYIGRLPECGCVVAIVVDAPEIKKDVARHLADFVKRGYEVERVPLAEGAQMVGPCKHKDAPKPKPDAKQEALL